MKTALVILLIILGGCASLERPQTFTEQVAYVDATSKAAIKTLADLTCQRYTPAGACTEPGKPLHPAKSIEYLERISQARLAARTAAAMPAQGGECLGKPSTPAACLGLAQGILREVEKILTSLQKKGA